MFLCFRSLLQGEKDRYSSHKRKKMALSHQPPFYNSKITSYPFIILSWNRATLFIFCGQRLRSMQWRPRQLRRAWESDSFLFKDVFSLTMSCRHLLCLSFRPIMLRVDPVRRMSSSIIYYVCERCVGVMKITSKWRGLMLLEVKVLFEWNSRVIIETKGKTAYEHT